MSAGWQHAANTILYQMLLVSTLVTDLRHHPVLKWLEMDTFVKHVFIFCSIHSSVVNMQENRKLSGWDRSLAIYTMMR